MTERYIIIKTSYKPPRGLIFDDTITLMSISALTKPWGFRVKYYGYDKMSMRYVYQYVTVKKSYKPLVYDKVILYHHGDMTPEEWLGDLKSRLMRQGRRDFNAANMRYLRAKKNREKNYQYKRRRKPK